MSGQTRCFPGLGLHLHLKSSSKDLAHSYGVNSMHLILHLKSGLSMLFFLIN